MHPGQTNRTAAQRLTSLELGLVAKLNLEMAAAHDEVAEDPSVPEETRMTARKCASRLRERARLFSTDAQRLAAYPALATQQFPPEQTSRYTGPERRRHKRRGRERRGSPALPGPPVGVPERRIGPGRRQRERRAQPRSVL